MPKMDPLEAAKIIETAYGWQKDKGIPAVDAALFAASILRHVVSVEPASVKCEECKWGWHNGGHSKDNVWAHTFHCNKHNCDMDFDDYCSFGERKIETLKNGEYYFKKESDNHA